MSTVVPQVTPLAFRIRQNSAWVQPVTFWNADKSRFDLSTVTLNGQIRDGQDYTPTPRAWLTITVINAAMGEITCALSAHDAGTLPASFAAYVAEIMCTPNADPLNPFSFAKGTAAVESGGNSRPGQGGPAPTVPLQTLNLIVGGASTATTRALLGLSKKKIAYQVLMG
jgi:hypothetical protein